MRLRLWLLVALAAIALLASRTPVFHDPSQQNSSVEHVFDTVLQERYPGWAGYRTCVTSPEAGHDVCWAELHDGNRFRQVEIGVDLTTSQPEPSGATLHQPWTRGPMDINSPGGSGTANTREYAWDYLMRSVNAKHLPATFVDVDGDPTGFALTLFTFHCTGAPARVTCKNALGDAITYTPHDLQSY